MSIDVTWYNDEKTIMYIQYHSQWTLEDFHKMLDQSLRMTEHSKPFVVIGDFSESSMLPNGLLSTGRRIQQTAPSHRLMLILVQPNMLMNMLIRTVSSIYPRIFDNAHVVANFEEALEVAQARLEEADATQA